MKITRRSGQIGSRIVLPILILQALQIAGCLGSREDDSLTAVQPEFGKERSGGLEVSAGPDTIVLKGESLHLKGVVVSGTGRIVQRFWMLPGENFWRPLSREDTVVTISGDRIYNWFIFRAIDEYGNNATDTRLVKRGSPGEFWHPVQVTLPNIPERDVKRTCLVFEDKVWMFLSSEDDAGVHPVEIWNSSDMLSWHRVSGGAEFPARIVRGVANFEHKMWVIGGEKSMGGRYGYNDIWASSDGDHWKRFGLSTPLDTGNNGDQDFYYGQAPHYDFKKNRYETAGHLWLYTYNGEVFKSTNGITWESQGQGLYRADQIYTIESWSYGLCIWGRDGRFIHTWDGITADRTMSNIASQSWPVATYLRRDGEPFKTGFMVVNDGYKAFTYSMDNRQLVGEYDFPERWTEENHGLYPHCQVAFHGKVWALQGVRFRGEARKPVEMWVTY